MSSADEDLDAINEALDEMCQSGVRCVRDASKGRTLVAGRSFKSGEEIFGADTLHTIYPKIGNIMYDKVIALCLANAASFEFEPIWYFAGLCSLTVDQVLCEIRCHCQNLLVSSETQRKLLMLHHDELPSIPSEAAKILVENFVEPNTITPFQLDSLVSVWSLNSFQASKSGGMKTFWLASLMSHSCRPFAIMKDLFESRATLRALCDVNIGEEITISYLDRNELQLSTKQRQDLLLDSKKFLCACSRCKSEGTKCRKSRARRLRREEIKTINQELLAVA